MSKQGNITEYVTKAAVGIRSDASLAEARERMFELGVRHLPVIHDRKLVGILSQRDVALAESLTGSDALTVDRAMQPNPFTVGPMAKLHAVAKEMAEHKYGTAVVVDPEQPLKVLGIFTTIDALRALADLAGPSAQ